ncbi:uncharacterized protein N7503_008529 [Penicillium pulvis]|uniref:uncharacterized protein n=1 Tax=Penicillium pulvis TaxID=1562058 RepID=UPI0025477971|nr:uncharacterized protein N7503_008529 [Penicillium pulvis]KAJ5792551.1 hypothetical protein N7503_008529 [Penicillium pulvis]
MASGEGEMPSPATKRPRARAACDECRRRKLRCDGRQPQCSICHESGLICETTERGSRGPKKGYIKALKDRVVYLENLLENRLDGQPEPSQHHDGTESRDEDLPTPPVDIPDPIITTDAQDWMSAAVASISEPDMLLPNDLPDLGLLSDSLAPPVSFSITGAIQSELDQLYFDRVHASIPILHQRRYLSWATSPIKTASCKSLQLVMWTMATLMSAQFRDLTEPLYHEAKQTLKTLDTGDVDGHETELVQAWVLIAMCESMRTQHRQAWMSAGQAFRILQGKRFHELDSPKKNTQSMEDDPIHVEEKRRVFWMAYFLDHLLSIRNDWPITLNEHVICTRLPSPDQQFQNGQPILGEFLSEVMTESSITVQSPFNECLILLTICGRSLLQGQQLKISTVYGHTASGDLKQCHWLDELLTTRLQILAQFYPSPNEAYDPLLWFANILSHTAFVYCCNSLMQTLEASGGTEDNAAYMGYQSRALTAVEAIVGLSQMLPNLHFSKVHPLMPLPLFMVAEFLYDNVGDNPAFELYLQELVTVAEKLKNVNNLEQSYMDLMPQSCISKTTELLNSHVGRA